METGLADDQRFAFQKSVDGNLHEVTFEGSEHVPFALRNRPYEEIYRHLHQQRAYNVKMLDGALIQMMYNLFRRSASAPSTCLLLLSPPR